MIGFLVTDVTEIQSSFEIQKVTLKSLNRQDTNIFSVVQI